MRFSLTAIAIALLGTAAALPSPDINSVGERAAVSRHPAFPRRARFAGPAANPRAHSNAVVSLPTATQRQTAAAGLPATPRGASVSPKVFTEDISTRELEIPPTGLFTEPVSNHVEGLD